MRVLMINVSLRPTSQTLLPPVGFAYIATAVYNSGYSLKILDIDANRYSDLQVEEYLKTNNFDIVLMGCIVTGYRIIKKLSATIKSIKNVPIILGNSVGDSIPDIIFQKTDIDYIVEGEGDISVVELLDALVSNSDLSTVDGIYYKHNGEIIKTPKRDAIPDLDELPFINWDLFEIEKYIERSKYYVNEPHPIPFEEVRALPINTARGCPYRCTFCYHVFKKDKYRYRSPENICSEMRMLKDRYSINYINFFDELTFYSKEQCEALVGVLTEADLGIYWNASCRATLFKDGDQPLVRKMKESGCMGLGYSLESASDVILESMNKRITVTDFIEHTRVLQECGVATWTSIVVGYPEETEETLNQTFDVCLESMVYPSSGYLLPLPGTKMFEYAFEKGYVKDTEEYLLGIGDRQDFTINLSKMRQEEMEGIVKDRLIQISDKMKLGLNQENLIKTGRYKSKITTASEK